MRRVGAWSSGSVWEGVIGGDGEVIRFPGGGVVETEEVASGRGSADGGVTMPSGTGGEVLSSQWTLNLGSREQSGD